jgi:hypothetical protein
MTGPELEDEEPDLIEIAKLAGQAQGELEALVEAAEEEEPVDDGV